MARYLTEHLCVPEDHIQRLLGHTPTGTTISNFNQIDTNSSIPTRANIKNALLGLSTNPQIHHGDSIIIYFAGHGTVYQCRDYPPYEGSVAESGTIEALCPINRVAPDNGVIIPDISDREINTILSEISRTKGHRITFILDCCHSSSRVRGEATVRSIAPLPSRSIQDMFDAADKTLGHLPGYESISREVWRPNMDSHVVLVACQEHELAIEVERDEGYHGIFTRALISTLKSVNIDHDSMTYMELLQTLPVLDHQMPVIAGKWMYEQLWFEV